MADLEETLRLVELTCARLCHDLGGLIGTIGNALDMVTEDAGQQSEVVAFAATAAKALTRRLRLMRAAWGPETNAMTLSGLRALSVPALEARRIVLDTGALPPDCVFSPSAGRVVLNLVLLACDCLPKGGTILLMGEPSDLFIRIRGPISAWPAGLSGCVHDQQTAFDALREARTVQMPLVVLLAFGARLRISPVLGPGGVEALRLTAA
jgi:histidine phosphotransferase ChpT